LTRRRPAHGHEQDGVFSPEITPPQRVAIRRVLARGLADRPEDRYTTAVAFVEALAAMKVETQSRCRSRPVPSPTRARTRRTRDRGDRRLRSAGAVRVRRRRRTRRGSRSRGDVIPAAPVTMPEPVVTMPEPVVTHEPVVAMAEPVATVVEPVAMVAAPVAIEAAPVAEIVDHPLTVDPPRSPWRPIDEPLPLGSLPLFGTHTTSPVATESRRRVGLGLAATVALIAGGHTRVYVLAS
jgi:hypothetical protein